MSRENRMVGTNKPNKTVKKKKVFFSFTKNENEIMNAKSTIWKMK